MAFVWGVVVIELFGNGNEFGRVDNTFNVIPFECNVRGLLRMYCD